MNKEDIVTINKGALLSLLRMAYEVGYGGYLDLASSTVSGLLEEYLESADGKQTLNGPAYVGNMQSSGYPSLMSVDEGGGSSSSVYSVIHADGSSIRLEGLGEVELQQISAEGQQPFDPMLNGIRTAPAGVLAGINGRRLDNISEAVLWL